MNKMKNVAVYIKMSQENETKYLENVEDIFRCCFHKNLNICEFYIEKENNEKWNELFREAEKTDRKWNELIVPDLSTISESTFYFGQRIDTLRKLKIKLTVAMIYNDFYVKKIF